MNHYNLIQKETTPVEEYPEAAILETPWRESASNLAKTKAREMMTMSLKKLIK